MKALNFLISMATILFIASCIETGSNEGSSFKEIIPVEIDPNEKVTFEVLKSQILEPMCLRCHGWATNQAQVDTRVVAGNIAASELFAVVEDGSMPKGGPQLTNDQLEIVRRYIEDKAAGNTGPVNPNPNPTPAPPVPQKVTYEVLNTRILAPKCIRCHSDMGTEEGLATYVTAGDETTSDLYLWVADGRMPRRGTPLNESELDMVRRYILGLTSGNPRDDDDDDDDDDDRDDIVIVKPEPIKSTFSELSSKILAPKCLRCHEEMSSEGGLSEYLVPGNANASALYKVVANGSMPRRGTPLNEEELAIVRSYINSL